MVLSAPDQGKPAARPGRKANGSLPQREEIARLPHGRLSERYSLVGLTEPQQRSFAIDKSKPAERQGRKATGLPPQPSQPEWKDGRRATDCAIPREKINGPEHFTPQCGTPGMVPASTGPPGRPDLFSGRLYAGGRGLRRPVHDHQCRIKRPRHYPHSDRKARSEDTRLNSSHVKRSRMPSSA